MIKVKTHVALSTPLPADGHIRHVESVHESQRPRTFPACCPCRSQAVFRHHVQDDHTQEDDINEYLLPGGARVST